MATNSRIKNNRANEPVQEAISELVALKIKISNCQSKAVLPLVSQRADEQGACAVLRP